MAETKVNDRDRPLQEPRKFIGFSLMTGYGELASLLNPLQRDDTYVNITAY